MAKENKQMKIVLISHTFLLDYRVKRWRLLAQEHPDIDVTCLAPAEFLWHSNKAYSFGKAETLKGYEIDEGNFHLRLYHLCKLKKTWLSPDFKKIFLAIKPDVIYNVGNHQQLSLVQIAKIVRRYLPDTKLMFFSMRGPSSDLKFIKKEGGTLERIKNAFRYLYFKPIVNYALTHYDAVFCHYPDAVKSFRKEGFKGPIYMQTQVGYNMEWFHPDDKFRNEIRDKYNLGDSFVFGSATRFTPDKGLQDIIAALPKEGKWKFLMIGAGSSEDENRIRRLIKSAGIEGKVILTGYIDRLEMAKYWNAIDCAVHVPRTTPHWEETFSLAIIQAMGTRKPIIGNTSGSVPYQIGVDGIIVPEGDINALHEKMCWAMTHPQELDDIADKMYFRASHCFSIQHLNDIFYDTILDVRNGKIDEDKFDMTTYKI